ncbi:hypothetical protein EV361DRAFT_874606, partial [Lentinula raphanica]
PATSTRGLPAPANVPAQRGSGAVTPWHPPAISNSTRSALTTNERRVASYQQAGPPGISKLGKLGRNANRGVSRNTFPQSAPLPATVPSSKGKGKGKAVVEMTFDIVILPECCDGGNDETANETGSNAYPAADAIIVKQTDVRDLVDRLARYQFVFSVTLPDDRTASEEVHAFLHDEICSHLSFLGIVLTYPRATIGKYGWYVVDTITKPRKEAHTRKPFEFHNKHALALNTSSFFERTNLKNYLNTTTKVHPYLESGYLFICPSGSPMYLQGHPCVGLKLLHEWTVDYRLYHEDREDPQVQCLPLCPSERTHILHHPFPKKPRSVDDLPDPNVPLLRGPLEQLGVDDEDDRDIQAGLSERITSPQSLDADDDEAADIARAIALSIQDQVDPLSARQVSTGYDEFSSAGAGPSRAVGSISAPASLPPVAARRTRPLSPDDEVVFLPSDTNHARRRRLNDDEPEHSVQWFITQLGQHMGPRGGGSILVTAQSTSEAATAFIEAYLGLYGHSSTTVPRAVILSGDRRTTRIDIRVAMAVGDGVVRAVLNEALSLVMEDPVWIEMTEGLKTLGLGAPVTQDRLASIKMSG